MTARAAATGTTGMTPVRWLKVGALLALLVVIPPLASSQFITTVFIAALMLGCFGAIYDLMLGHAGLINFGYGGFIAAGAYTSALAAFHYGVNPFLGLLLAGVVTAVLGFFAGIITLRLRGLYIALLTFFLGEAIRFSISNTPDYTRGMLGLSTEPFPNVLGLDFSRANLLPYYYLLLLLVAAIMMFMWWLVRSKYGLAFKALREDELATESLGLSTTRYKLLNFTLGSFLTGVMGGYYAHYLGILSPTPEEFGIYRTVEVLTITYIGGRGSLWGPLFGAFLIVGFQEYFRGMGAWRLVLYGVLLIVVMLFARRGLSGLKKYVW